MRGARPTMRDVAERAGVSLKTVSRVINGEPGVAADTAARVERGDRRASASSATTSRARCATGRASATIGLVIEDVAQPLLLGDRAAVEDAARARGRMLITAILRGGPRARARSSSGAAAPPRRRAAHRPRRPPTTATSRRELAAGTPLVFLDRPPRRHRGRHRPARQPRRRARGGRAPARRRATAGSPSSRDARPRSTPRASASPATASALADAGVPDRPTLVRLGTHDAAAGRGVGPRRSSRLPADRRPTALFTRQQPQHGRRAARAARPPAARSRWSASTTSSSPTCSRRRPPSSATTPRTLGRHAAALAFARLDGDDGAAAAAVDPDASSSSADPGRCVRMKPLVLPPNVLHRFYPGGARIAALRGLELADDHTPEDWIGAINTVVRRATSAASAASHDGTLVRDAIAADPEALPRPGARRPLRRRPGAARQAARRRRAAPRALPPGPRLRAAAPRPDARQDRGVDRSSRPSRAPSVARRLPRGRRRRRRSRGWVREQDTTRCSARCNPLPVQAGRRDLRARPGTPHAIGAGILHRRAAGADRPLDPARVGRLRHRPTRTRRRSASAGTSRSEALDRAACDAAPLARPGPDARRAGHAAAPARGRRLLPRRAPRAGADAALDRGFAILVVTDGAGALLAEGGEPLPCAAATRSSCRTPRASCRPRGRRRGDRAAGRPPTRSAGGERDAPARPRRRHHRASRPRSIDADGAERRATARRRRPGATVPTGAEIDPDALLDAAIAAAAARARRGARRARSRGDRRGQHGRDRRPARRPRPRRCAPGDRLARRRAAARRPRRSAAELGERRFVRTHRPARHARCARWPSCAGCATTCPARARRRPLAQRRRVGRARPRRRRGRRALARLAHRLARPRAPRRRCADALAWAGLPAGPPPRARRSPGPRRPATPASSCAASAAPCSPSAATTTSPPAVGAGAVGDGRRARLVRHRRGVRPRRRAAARRRAVARRRRRRAERRLARRPTGRQALLGGLWSGLALRRSSRCSACRRGPPELEARALDAEPGDAPAARRSTTAALERSPASPADVAPRSALWRAALEAVGARWSRPCSRASTTVAGAAPRGSSSPAAGRATRPCARPRRALGPFETPPGRRGRRRGAALLGGPSPPGLFDQRRRAATHPAPAAGRST